MFKYRLSALALLFLASSCQAAPTPAPQVWKTAFYKRGFVGNYQAGWADGINSTLRMRVPIPFEGSQVRVTVAPMREEEVGISKMSLARGEGEAGVIEGAPVTFTFNGAPDLKIAPNGAEVVSDAAKAAITAGDWYLQESYSSEKYSYAYSVDGFFSQAGDHHEDSPAGQHREGVWPGNVYRVDVLTSDTRPIILCYGDSITHGYSSTPNAGKSYPELLSHLAKLPTLNLGVNGDVLTYTGGTPSIINSLNGVQSVIVLMGINDILTGQIKSVDDYAARATPLIDGIKGSGKKIYWGTLTPAAGYAEFDKDPAKETLRQGINTWIKTKAAVDGVIDFDKALADPAHPEKMRAQYQSDWLHPSDAGYQKMAETAAAQFASTVR